MLQLKLCCFLSHELNVLCFQRLYLFLKHSHLLRNRVNGFSNVFYQTVTCLATLVSHIFFGKLVMSVFYSRKNSLQYFINLAINTMLFQNWDNVFLDVSFLLLKDFTWLSC